MEAGEVKGRFRIAGRHADSAELHARSLRGRIRGQFLPVHGQRTDVPRAATDSFMATTFFLQKRKLNQTGSDPSLYIGACVLRCERLAKAEALMSRARCFMVDEDSILRVYNGRTNKWPNVV